jgi:agmatine deiminase
MNHQTPTILVILIAVMTLSTGIVLTPTQAHPLGRLDPPPTPIRQPGEFEQMTGALIAYPFGISYDVIKEMAENVTVCTIVSSISVENTVLSQYTSHGVDTDHCTFLIANSDTYWTRDYGPWFTFTGDNQQGITDFTYNRPRPDDDAIPQVYATNQSIPYSFMNLETAGGNYMTDGQGNAISTTLVWEENPGMSHDTINQTVHDYLGINRYMVVPDINGEYIKHIDCWGKYLSPDTILIRSVPQSHSQYDEIEAAVAYFKNQTSCYGTPYHVVRVYNPGNEPYTNSLILNNKVLVPQTGSQWDDEALQSYRDAMPGYEVLGFTGTWESTDALHCRVMGITDRGMLYLEHIPLQNQTTSTGYVVSAKIYAYSNQPLTTDMPRVYYNVNGGNWQSIKMEDNGDETYTATIPPQATGSIISYYIHAEDETGRTANHPYIGAAGAHTFTVLGEPDHPPLTPQRPDGNDSGKAKQTYVFTTMTTDPDNDNVLFLWDWGDNTTSDWLGPSTSGAVVNASHSWQKKGTYSIRVKAKDIYGLESNWSESFPVTMPLGCQYSWPLLDYLQEHFPLVFRLLTHFGHW